MFDPSSSSPPESAPQRKVLVVFFQAGYEMSRPRGLKENNRAKHGESGERPMLGMNCCCRASLRSEKISQVAQRLNLWYNSMDRMLMLNF